MIRYDVVALSVTIYYNREGDHDHNGMVFTLASNAPLLRYIDALARQGAPVQPGSPPHPDPAPLRAAAEQRARELRVPLPESSEQARQPHPLVRPLVLRARLGETVRFHLQNEITGRCVGPHLVGGGYAVTTDDGAQVGTNPSSLTRPGTTRVYTWRCEHEGVFPFVDGGNVDGSEQGTNVHGLFGALVVEPRGTTWRDPVAGLYSHGRTGRGRFRQLDGLQLDVLPPGTHPSRHVPSTTTLADHHWPTPCEEANYGSIPHREFMIFFHDQPEYAPAHGELEPPLCPPHEDGGGHDHHRDRDHHHDGHEHHDHDHGHDGHGPGGRDGADDGHGGGHAGTPSGHGEELPIMAVSYRAEPMINRERRLWRLIRDGHQLDRPVLNEEQHHSSWMFGDPAENLLLRAYVGDRVRIRFVHAAVKETHVFHLHLYEWHAVPSDSKSPRIDAISISPQTAHTIEPLWGAGNRHQVAGDVIWHCHLYPHFHEGMWGIFRSYETRQDGEDGATLDSDDPVYAGRRIGRYPDGTVIPRLMPLPGNVPPAPTPQQPGYPLYIPGVVQQKSPRPPWPDRVLTHAELHDGYQPPTGVTSLLAADMPPDFDYRPHPTDLERRAFNDLPVPGELFTRNRMADQQRTWDPVRLARNTSREERHDLVVSQRRIHYNDHGWHDEHGHLYHLAAEGDPADAAGPYEPLFFRAQHGQILNLTLHNDLPHDIAGTEFDHPFPPCDRLDWEGECAPHVHMVKFDPICADGASVGWNYMSGARFGKRMVYRWWADQEFGTIFFHDHLFANYRQKHGLFGALLVEPAGSRFLSPREEGKEIVSGLQAVVVRHPDDHGETVDGTPEHPWFREFCIGIADFIPMWDRRDVALNEPDHPGGHGDQGVMAINYRNEPLRERLGDPARWFSSRAHGDPATTVFETYADDPIWFRVVQGSHEESHSFQVHGLRWQRFRGNSDSDVRNQQTTGIAEAFTFVNRAPVRPGDHLYKLSGADDLWLGCWGLVRAHPLPAAGDRDLVTPEPRPVPAPPLPSGPRRRFVVTARRRRIPYRDDIIDPYGLEYRLDSVQGPGDRAPVAVPHPAATPTTPVQPLVLWCQEGEQVEVVLHNELPAGMTPEPFAPEVPVERPRPVSRHVSMHADLVAYDVRHSDGATVGYNPVQTVPPGEHRTYRWDTSRPIGATTSEPLGPVLLQDMADVRNHRHHGLIGALVILPSDATPYPVGPAQSTSASRRPRWYGPRVTVRSRRHGRTEEMVALLQDGLRLFVNGNERIPLPDPPPDPGEQEAEHEDQGQKGINLRSEPRGTFDPRNSAWTLAEPDPATPVWSVPRGRPVRFHLIGALDKPRAYSFTVHGVSWPEQRYRPDSGPAPCVSSESAVTCGTARTFTFVPSYTGDHAYRAGNLQWAVGQGMWGILRVTRRVRPGLLKILCRLAGLRGEP